MRKLVPFATLLCILLTTAALPAQEASSSIHDWSRVQALAAGTKLYIRSAQQSKECTLQVVDSASISCTSFGSSKERTYKMEDVTSVKLVKRGLSFLLGTIFGDLIMIAGGAGAASTGTKGFDVILWAALVGIGAVVSLLGGVMVGIADPAAKTIYEKA